MGGLRGSLNGGGITKSSSSCMSVSLRYISEFDLNMYLRGEIELVYNCFTESL